MIRRLGTIILFRGILPLLGCLPLSLRRAMGRVGGRCFSFFPTRERFYVQEHLRVFLPSSTRCTPAQVFAETGSTLMESLNLKTILENSPIEFSDEALVKNVLATPRGVIALTAHVGNWDLLGAFMASKGVPVTVIGREARDPEAQRILEQIRESYGVETLWRSRQGGVKAILKVLREGKVVAALLDQDTHVASIDIPFFGIPVRTPHTLIELGKKAGSQFLTSFLVRERGGQYKVYVEEIDSTLDTREILLEYHRRLERLLLQYPAQWVWFHKRWRLAPNGHRRSSKEYREWISSEPSCEERTSV